MEEPARTSLSERKSSYGENGDNLGKYRIDKPLTRVVVTGTDMPPGILPVRGALRKTPSNIFTDDLLGRNPLNTQKSPNAGGHK